MSEKTKSLVAAKSKVGTNSVVAELSKMVSRMESMLEKAKKSKIDDIKGMGINIGNAKTFLKMAEKSYETWPARQCSAFDKMIDEFGETVDKNLRDLGESIEKRSHREHKSGSKKFIIKNGLRPKRRLNHFISAHENAM